MRVSRLDWLILAALVAIWGTAFAGLRIASAEIAPAWIAATRLAVGAGLLVVIARIAGEPFPPLSNGAAWRAYALVGTIGTAAPFFLFAWASARMESTLLAICNGASPFFTAAMAASIAGDRLDARRIVGIGFGFAGLVALALPGALASGASPQTLGVAAALIGAAGYGLSNVLIKRAPPVGPTAAAAMFCLAGAAVAVPVAWLTSPLPPHLSAAAAISAVALGLGPTGIASVWYVMLIRRRGPVFTSFTTYLTPLWAAGVGVLFLHERPGPEAAAALGLVLAGLAVSNWPVQPRR